MRILIISPYHGGSHQAWAEGYQRYSAHDVELLTLPSRFWKWRMHGGAVTLARQFMERLDSQGTRLPDVIVATDMLDLATFLALIRRQAPAIPSVLYMHENQLTYPLPRDPNTGPMRRQRGERDLHYAFINYASMLAGDRVVFNSHYHRASFLEALPRFLRRFPECRELASVRLLREKSTVLPVGLYGETLGSSAQNGVGGTDLASPSVDAPLILWNQRWEYDKNPGALFAALYQIQLEGIPFRLALCGERFSRSPGEFEEASQQLAEHIVHAGYAERETYHRLLWSADVVVSTALHEFFGVSILEAIYCQTFPILPARLSYPELLPEAYHGTCLYEAHSQLMDRLRWALRDRQEASEIANQLASSVARYSWRSVAPQYDSYFAAVRDAFLKG